MCACVCVFACLCVPVCLCLLLCPSVHVFMSKCVFMSKYVHADGQITSNNSNHRCGFVNRARACPPKPTPKCFPRPFLPLSPRFTPFLVALTLQPVYAYGSGLSYTTFSYTTRNLSLNASQHAIQQYIADATAQHQYFRLGSPECKH